MKVFTLLLIGLGSPVLTFLMSWFELRPWRQAKHEHWTERARLYFPVRAAAASRLWVLPAVFTVASILGRHFWPNAFPAWPLVVVVSALGTLVGAIPMDREVFPRIPLPALLRQIAVGFIMRFLTWFIFLGALALMPAEFNIQTALIFGCTLVLWILWARSLWFSTGIALGWLQPAPERVKNIVKVSAERMGVPVSNVCLMQSSLAQAYALPPTRTLLFSERLLEILSDEELAAVCHHELGHLTESRVARWARYVGSLSVLPWVLIKPTLATFPGYGFYLLVANTIAIPYFYKKFSLKMEKRADTIAKSHEHNDGDYARALLRLHEDNLIPAVICTRTTQSHPHLYDRMIDAGLTPDFPRPQPARSNTELGLLCSVLLGVLVALWIIYTKEH